MKIDLTKILVAAAGAAVTSGVSQAATAPNNDMQPKDVPVVADIVKTAVANQVPSIPIVREAQAALDHATNGEAFYLSRQWWISMLGIASSVLAIFGIVFPAEMQEEVVKIAMAASGAITGLVLLYNRYWATKPIGGA